MSKFGDRHFVPSATDLWDQLGPDFATFTTGFYLFSPNVHFSLSTSFHKLCEIYNDRLTWLHIMQTNHYTCMPNSCIYFASEWKYILLMSFPTFKQGICPKSPNSLLNFWRNLNNNWASGCVHMTNGGDFWCIRNFLLSPKLRVWG